MSDECNKDVYSRQRSRASQKSRTFCAHVGSAGPESETWPEAEATAMLKRLSTFQPTVTGVGRDGATTLGL